MATEDIWTGCERMGHWSVLPRLQVYYDQLLRWVHLRITYHKRVIRWACVLDPTGGDGERENKAIYDLKNSCVRKLLRTLREERHFIYSDLSRKEARNFRFLSRSNGCNMWVLTAQWMQQSISSRSGKTDLLSRCKASHVWAMLRSFRGSVFGFGQMGQGR